MKRNKERENGHGVEKQFSSIHQGSDTIPIALTALGDRCCQMRNRFAFYDVINTSLLQKGEGRSPKCLSTQTRLHNRRFRRLDNFNTEISVCGNIAQYGKCNSSWPVIMADNNY
ncbi:hypothetical protein CEXT_193461 [Caerostris extrusa]|uniref:Uncharacterized protein n=1 Tax=Caerostris extrusa TaxID=172846 RepID=A0AAV4PBN1_CAEEX|nr:hypothetical protein CEXT_193461 [Caerostris extrusa]